MQNLKLGYNSITSVYELLGDKEDDMTYGLGYVLSKSPAFLSLALLQYGHQYIDPELCKIQLQRHEIKDRGYSDIEIWYREKRLLIIEAKKGWVLPNINQLEKYKGRFTKNDFPSSIGVLSECSNEYAKRNLNKHYKFVSWKTIYKLLNKAYNETTSIIEKNHLNEYSTYLSKLITMDREQSNWVYCVSLSRTKVKGSDATFIDIVNKYSRYFFPYNQGNGWPTEAPNYLAFRYDGKLQSIHKVEKFEVNDNLNQSMPTVISDNTPDLHFYLHLGPAIKPPKVVKNGKIWPNGRLWCMIDTLLTCDTIEEARNISQERMKR
ncbi:hypothetical protein D1164_04545 [Mariniphaga sediminis]|uniref:Uncharacterized protein n=1 Tax=Mariniphaga sediminis TaxID=1628158 RepID=A0A399D2J4_9BACT|nr:PD-(D/E)XK nuclease family protein [Mariniphaga sediminis]RIH66185.1 hypothetical protein D1164_04545 [Mariniphaga sediminis]